MMKSREIFWLAVKIIGFIILIQGFRNCVEALLIAKGYYNTRLTTPQYWAAWAVIKIVFGVYLMVGGVPFLNLAFPLNAAAASDGNEPSGSGGLGGVKKDDGDLFGPKVMFGVAVKVIGLILVLYGLSAGSVLNNAHFYASGSIAKRTVLRTDPFFNVEDWRRLSSSHCVRMENRPSPPLQVVQVYSSALTLHSRNFG